MMDILQYIPHRPPFLWVDSIISCKDDQLEAEKYIDPALPVFEGHYPGHPLMPGVLLCESIFQAGAALITEIQTRRNAAASTDENIPVLTRIENARFKQQIHPGDTIRIHVSLVEVVGPAWFMKGKITVNNKTAVTVKFTCAVVPSSE
jgi:3-hydroxyacyl-[acyl-carrier-protein] dehydratase